MQELSYAGLTDRGLIRRRNEDSCFGDPEMGLFIVSDGMGGHAGGDLASKMVVEILPQLLRPRLGGIEDVSDSRCAETIIWALDELNTLVLKKGGEDANDAGMGATVVLALIRNGKALIAHLGDSRAYLLRNGHLAQLTRDHSVIQNLLDAEKITAEEAISHPARGQITRCIGMPYAVQPEIQWLKLVRHDRLLLCSDGLTEMVSAQQMVDLLLANTQTQSACQALIAAANEAGGIDNIAVLLIEWQGKDQDEKEVLLETETKIS